jgi:hypothetical protein
MKVVLVESEFMLKFKGIELEVIKECLDYCIDNNIVNSKHTCKHVSEGINELLNVDNKKIEKLD